MALQIRRGTDAQRSATRFGQGELVYTTDLKDLWIGDGITNGGTQVAPVKSVNSQTGTVVLTTDNVGQGSTNLYYSTAKAKQDAGAALIAGNGTNTNITFSYNNGVINASVAQVSGISSVSVDTSPQLGGNLSLNSHNITGTGSINITGGITATTLSANTGLGANLNLNTFSINGTGNIGITGNVVASGYAELGSVKMDTNLTTGGLVIKTQGYTVSDNYDLFSIKTANAQTGSNYAAFSRSRGTIASPTSLNPNDEIFSFIYAGYGTDNNAGLSAKLTVASEGTLGAGIVPGNFNFFVADNSGTLNSVLAIHGVGQLVNVNNLTIAGTTVHSSTANATGASNSTGALQVAGGAGIAKDVFVGGNLTITGNIQVNGSTTTVNNTTITTNDLTLTLANNAVNSAAANGAGIIVNGPATPASILWNSTNSAWTSNSPFFGTSANFSNGMTITGAAISANAGVQTTSLSASSTVSGAGFSAYLASPPSIGTTVAAAGNFTSIGLTSPGTGTFTSLNANSQVTFTPSNSNVIISPVLGSAITVTGASGTGTIATLTFASQSTPPFGVGSQITVSGITGGASGYNTASATVTACTTTSVSYSNTATASYTSGGSITGSALVTISPAGILTLGTAGVQNTVQGNVYAATSNQTITFSPSGTGGVTISPSGSASVVIQPTTAGSIDNMIIGVNTPVEVRSNQVVITAGTTTRAPLQFTSGANLATAAAGVVEYDGTSFYGSPIASNRAVVVTDHLIAQTNSWAPTATVNTAQQIFNSVSNGTITVPAATSYVFELVFNISNTNSTAVSHTLQLAFGGTATITSLSYSAMVGQNSAGFTTPTTPTITTSSTAALTAVTSAITTPAYRNVVVKGIVRFNAAGTFIPQFAFSSAMAAANTASITANSYFRMNPIGSNTVVNVGNWS